MGGQRLAGILWLIAGISSGGISFFLVDPLDLAILSAAPCSPSSWGWRRWSVHLRRGFLPPASSALSGS